MKKSINIFLKTVLFSSICLVFFVTLGYKYLDKKIMTTETETQKVPYTQEYLENAGILLELNGEKTFFYLDFDNEKVIVSLKPEEVFNNEIYGYSVDYKLNADTSVLKTVTDYLDGLELDFSGETLRYTGAQVKILAEENNSHEYKRKIIIAVFEKMNKRGVGRDFFVNLIQNSDTDLNISDCYFWSDKIADISANLQIID